MPRVPPTHLKLPKAKALEMIVPDAEVGFFSENMVLSRPANSLGWRKKSFSTTVRTRERLSSIRNSPLLSVNLGRELIRQQSVGFSPEEAELSYLRRSAMEMMFV